MNFLYDTLFKKYYPIKNTSIFYGIKEREYDILTRWVKNIESDILCWNVVSKERAAKSGMKFYQQIKLTYPKSVNDLYLLLKNKQFTKLDEEDLEFVNDVLYRHKYNPFISYFIFPIK